MTWTYYCSGNIFWENFVWIPHQFAIMSEVYYEGSRGRLLNDATASYCDNALCNVIIMLEGVSRLANLGIQFFYFFNEINQTACIGGHCNISKNCFSFWSDLDFHRARRFFAPTAINWQIILADAVPEATCATTKYRINIVLNLKIIEQIFWFLLSEFEYSIPFFNRLYQVFK